jgi:acyl-CoA synthetase (AMP-forming)/AMP-acid ligase II
MYPGTYAAQAPDKIAAVMAGTGDSISYGELERRSVQLARVLRQAGLRPGDVVALLTENGLRALEVYWAALRSGLYITAVNYRLKPDEMAYIVNDSGAAALIVSAEQAATATAVADLTAAVTLRLAFGGSVSGYDSYEETIAAAPDTPLGDQPQGATMLYSSGTTGRPKGVRPPLPGVQVGESAEGLVELARLVRGQYDTSSLRVAIHAAAPCPVQVKQKMIEWWGPILVEYYAGTEGNGMTAIDSGTWLTKPGTVGRPILGTVRICADDGTELPMGQTGGVYFERDEVPFTYHNDPAKTLSSQHPAHPTWTTLGDIGYLDEDGFLFLTDRKAFTIISGGVNIYPQETENALTLHPAVFDVAVIGVPDPEMGESVAAFVQPAAGAVPGPELEQEIIAFVKSKIAGFKAPRTVRFVDDLPRNEAGKLVKTELKARYAR